MLGSGHTRAAEPPQLFSFAKKPLARKTSGELLNARTRTFWYTQVSHYHDKLCEGVTLFISVGVTVH